MSSITKSTPSDPAAGTNLEPESVTPEMLVAQLRAIRNQVAIPAQAAAPAALRRRLAHVHPHFVNASINAAGVSDTVQSALGRTDEDLRQETAEIARWTAVTDEIHALEEVVNLSITVRRQRLGLAALQTYQICRQLARDERHATRLGPHIAEMKRLNRFGRRRKAVLPEPVASTKTQ